MKIFIKINHQVNLFKNNIIIDKVFSSNNFKKHYNHNNYNLLNYNNQEKISFLPLIIYDTN